MTPVRAKRKSFDPQNRRKLERSVKVRKPIARTGGFPDERLAEPFAVDGDQKQIALTGEVSGRRLLHLYLGRKMNEAIFNVDRRAAKDFFGRGDAP